MRRSIVLIALMLTACGQKPPTPPPALPTGDAVLQLLQKRVTNAIRGEDNFQVQSIQDATFIFPVGTVMVPGRTIGLNRTACAPSAPAGDYDMPNLFNSLWMKGSAAFDLGLDHAVAQLASAGVKAGQDDVFRLSVDHALGEFLLDDELTDLLKQPACSAYLQGKTVNLVRGFIIGKRSYELGRSRSAGGGIGVSNVGNLKVELSSDNGIKLVDESPVKFLQIVSSITIPAAPPPPPPPPPGAAPSPPLHVPFAAIISVPLLPSGPGRVYLQRDVADASDHAAQVKSLLSGLSLNVVPQVEAIDSGKMPKAAQVRYFNRSDEGVANRAVASLRTIFPDATTLFVGLKAPDGQLEVWLPRVGTASPAAVFTERSINAIPGAVLATRPVRKVPVGALATRPQQ